MKSIRSTSGKGLPQKGQETGQPDIIAPRMQLYVAIGVPILVLTCWYYTASIAKTRFPTLRNKAIVLLIAHPDDEAMFFAPSVLALTRPELGNHLKILCLSNGRSPFPPLFPLLFPPPPPFPARRERNGDPKLTTRLAGNAENIGAVRRREILASAKMLGLRSEADVLVHEDPAFPDSMSVAWDAGAISALLSSLFSEAAGRPARKDAGNAGRGKHRVTSIDVLLTFDRGGISGHPNHRSLYHGAVAWVRALVDGKTGGDCPVALYTLTSTNIVRKYMFVLDAPLTILLCVIDSMRGAGKRGKCDVPRRLMFLSDTFDYVKARSAMVKAHRSQMVWFRWGWIGIGRYMVVNDLRRVTV